MIKMEQIIMMVLKLVRVIETLFTYLITWILIDIIYMSILFIYQVVPDIKVFTALFAHISGIIIASMVMFTGLGAGMLWLPLLTFIGVSTSEAVSLSLFTQIAGKGIGSYNYYRSQSIELRIFWNFLPYVCLGVIVGYVTGFIISVRYERLLLVIFVCVAFYLLVDMVRSLYEPPSQQVNSFSLKALKDSKLIVITSSFFTGLLSIGNSDWLIPHMNQKLNISTHRSVATGIFIMFTASLFYLLLTWICILMDLRSWPENSSLLFLTCSGVIIGGQIGTRIVSIPWFHRHQKHAFILFLSLSLIHLLW